MTNGKRGIALGALLLGVAAPAHGWGTQGHEAIVRLAARRTVDPCFQGYLHSKLSTIVNESMAPDRWKGFDSDEPPRHYLNLDVEADFAQYPRTFAEAVAKYGAARAVQQGLVPWRTAEFVDKLKARFAAKDANGAAAIAGQLGHYVGDAHSPLHATLNFDGQRTGNSGLHQRWEVDMPRTYGRELESRAATLAATLAEPEGDAVLGIFAALATGAVLVPAIVEVDLLTRGTPSAFFEAQGEMAALRFAQAAALLASLWRSAFTMAGAPALEGMQPSCFPRAGVDAGTAPRPTRPADAGSVPITVAAGDEEGRLRGGGGCASVGSSLGPLTGVALLGVLAALALARRRRTRSR